MTIDCDNAFFKIKGTPWAGRSLYNLYGEAYTPWEWQADLKKVAEEIGLDFFSTPFDATAVDFLENLQVPAYKIASFEIVDLPLIRKIAQTGKPAILSTGMATLAEIEEAIQSFQAAGGNELLLLKCTSSYPAPPQEMHLRTIPHLAASFSVPVGLSDHSKGLAVAVASVALGACAIEKHLTLSRKKGGPDSSFSLEPAEFKEMVSSVRTTEKALGTIRYGTSPQERSSRVFRRSIFAVKDIKAGEPFTDDNIRSIRPGFGLHTRYLETIVGRIARMDIKRGTPLKWEIL
jgi:pseudaminic acid synthase